MKKTANISAKEIQKLREATNAGVMACKHALEQSKGDLDKAMKVLREKGIAMAAKKAGRVTREGRIEAYIHSNNKIGVLVEINCETDFVSRCDDFKHFAKDVAMQIAALNPAYVKKEDVPKNIVKENKACIDNFYKANCLLEQAFVKDQGKTIQDCLSEIIGKIGENMVISRFIRFQLGE